MNLLGNVGKMRIFFGKALNPRSKSCFCIVLRSWFFVLHSCAFVLLSWQIKCSLNVEKSFNALRALRGTLVLAALATLAVLAALAVLVALAVLAELVILAVLVVLAS